jgi:hypothetical protein
MGSIWIVAGSAVLTLVTLDMVRTVLRVETHSGPLTRALSVVLWRGAHRLPGRHRHGVAPGMTGVGVTVTLVATWLLLTWLGWFLVFAGAEQAVVHGDTGQPADMWARAYYTAYTISTLGIGDYVPGGPAWQILTGVAATAGFAIATLVLTYMASLTSAVATSGASPGPSTSSERAPNSCCRGPGTATISRCSSNCCSRSPRS